MESARRAGRAFSPLDDELALLPGALTPSLQEDLVRLGVWMPFGRAAMMCLWKTNTAGLTAKVDWMGLPSIPIRTIPPTTGTAPITLTT